MLSEDKGGVSDASRLRESRLETKTQLHLTHQQADLRIYDVVNEPGRPAPDSALCVCRYAYDQSCQKCAPDPKRVRPTKKICDCKLGVEPDPSYFVKPKRKKPEPKDWYVQFEKKRAKLVCEKWAVFLEQRKARFEAITEKEKGGSSKLRVLTMPIWFQKLSCNQVLYLEFLALAIRLDIDEGCVDRTYYVLSGIGLYPRPQRKQIKKSISACNYNSIHFLNHLQCLLKYKDKFEERNKAKFTWNDMILMSCTCHLEFPMVLRELMDRLPKLPRDPLLPQIPYPVYKRPRKSSWPSPYLEPLYTAPLNWAERANIDRINRVRAHMDTRRVKVPALALLKRPSLIDARPPFLPQIEAMEKRNERKEKKQKPVKKRPKCIPKFDSNLDLTVVQDIVSEVSVQIDPESTCMFSREQSKVEVAHVSKAEEEGEFMGPAYYEEEDYGLWDKQEDEDEEEEEDDVEKEHEEQEEENISFQYSEEGDEERVLEGESDHRPFLSPPKTQSGTTIAEPCPAPVSSPAPPAQHYMIARRNLEANQQEICAFNDLEPGDEESILKHDFSLTKTDKQLEETAKKLEKVWMEQKGIDPNDFNEAEKRKHKKKKSKKKVKKDKQKKGDMLDVKKRNSPKTDNEQDFETFREIPKKKPCPPGMKKAKRRKRKKKVNIDAVTTNGEEEEDKIMTADKVTMTECVPGEYDYLYQLEEQVESVFTGDPWPLVRAILHDLVEEGYYSPAYEKVEKHPDIKQLIQFLRGEIVTKARREEHMMESISYWALLGNSERYKLKAPDVKISKRLTYNDRAWVSRITDKAKNKFLFDCAKMRAKTAKDFYPTTFQNYYGSDTYLKHFYAYFVSKYEDSNVKGLSMN